MNYLLNALLAVLLFSTLSCGNKVSFELDEKQKTTAEEGSLTEHEGLLTETFKQTSQVESSQVDIVVIYDNSTSMSAIYNNFRASFSLFFHKIQDADWKLAMVSADYKENQGKFVSFSDGRNFLDKTNQSYEEEFFNKVTDYENCILCSAQTFERPLSTLSKALKSSQNQDFFRPNAETIILFITNEDEGYFGKKVSKVVSETKSFFNERVFQTYGLLLLPRDTQCLEAQPQGSQYGTKVNEFIKKTGGKSYSVCLPSYNEIFSDMFAQISKVYVGVETQFTLTQQPEEGSVKVEVSPADETLQYDIQGSTIVFNKPPQAHSVIKVSYAKKVEETYIEQEMVIDAAFEITDDFLNSLDDSEEMLSTEDSEQSEETVDIPELDLEE